MFLFDCIIIETAFILTNFALKWKWRDFCLLMENILLKNKLGSLIKKWQKSYKVFSVVKNGSQYLWQEISSVNESINSALTQLPPKIFFLPKEEEIFSFISDKILLPKTNDKKNILFALADYDLVSIKLLDRIFYNDYYYQKRRMNYILVGVGTILPESGYDLFLLNHGNNWIIKIGSNEGKKLVDKKNILTIPNSQKILNKPADPLFRDLPKLVSAVKNSYQNKIWDELAKICFGCGICSYVCPLCYCFSQEDSLELNKKKCPTNCKLCQGKRVRLWDSCMLEHFSEVAGGHNFREKLRDRIYNWYFHKFVRFPQEFGQVGCVSCGRCIKYCPAKINYRLVLEKILAKYSK